MEQREKEITRLASQRQKEEAKLIRQQQSTAQQFIVQMQPATYYTDPGHTFPDLIRGLSIKGFGIYNCDAISRVQNLITIHAKWTDESGKEIEDLRMLSVIDKRINGAFSFDPSLFKCGADGRNVLVLLTNSKALYILKESEWKSKMIKSDGTYTFQMKNVSKEVRNSIDLAKYIGV
ncbi:MAG: hypothetical protein GC181_16580 [Bacteroidetes bacterium]|nr:hypothetical protein [Bacteroidota bacterium]